MDNNNIIWYNYSYNNIILVTAMKNNYLISVNKAREILEEEGQVVRLNGFGRAIFVG